MEFTTRLDPYALDDVAPDEELPSYEPYTAPNYEGEDYETPLFSYHLRQVNRKLQILVPFGPTAATSYKIISHTSFRFFSKKPDIDLVRVSPEHPATDSVASIRFDSDGPLPWRPRAHFSHISSYGTNTYQMESKNFADWAISIEGISFTWCLEGRPVSLVLSEKNSSIAIAKFLYSRCGTLAANGAEVGELTIYRDGLSVERDGIEKIICGLLIAMVHFKRMGRHYWNHADIRANSLTRSHLPSHRASFASYPNL
ncbi:hypothetical protein K469DRAFT_728529 [Zopfia rhizophila CBS 207.26]|uniref:Uncharacterized protein n=1 Tax=Zopfia rhizophila CBS 207.26 TaxID=1314779 RepID=A0A6A6DWI0_9PEZI|nr:hypothetical protein K469DRAFT_728529 [Zopfia rhizophila CBS 207.26]